MTSTPSPAWHAPLDNQHSRTFPDSLGGGSAPTTASLGAQGVLDAHQHHPTTLKMGFRALASPWSLLPSLAGLPGAWQAFVLVHPQIPPPLFSLNVQSMTLARCGHASCASGGNCLCTRPCAPPPNRSLGRGAATPGQVGSGECRAPQLAQGQPQARDLILGVVT